MFQNARGFMPSDPPCVCIEGTFIINGISVFTNTEYIFLSALRIMISDRHNNIAHFLDCVISYVQYGKESNLH